MTQWIVENYHDTRGRAPVDEYLKTLPPVDLARVLRTIDLLVDYGPLLKMPHVRHLTGKIWEFARLATKVSGVLAMLGL